MKNFILPMAALALTNFSATAQLLKKLEVTKTHTEESSVKPIHEESMPISVYYNGSKGNIQASDLKRTNCGSLVRTKTDISTPLYLVDGALYLGAVTSISPDQIADIKILKDADATAKYGENGGDGVIEITTKNPKAATPNNPRTNPRIEGAAQRSNNGPLYIVDGKTQEADISNVPPNTIESLNILKGATAKSLFGAAGSEGVIVITTKKPKKDLSEPDKPLYVVDGKLYLGRVATIKPESIENITILKGADATAKYGDNGAHGVIEITTKTLLTAANETWAVFPNPSSGIVTLRPSYQASDKTTFSVVSEMGKGFGNFKARKLDDGSYQLDLGKLANGVYLITSYDGFKANTTKVVLSR